MKAFPPLLYAGGLAAGLALGRGTATAGNGARVVRAMAFLCVGTGMAVAAGAGRAFEHADTSSNPYEPTTSLVTGGVFAASRNPAYVAATSLYLGIALFARSLPALTLLPIVLALLDRLVVDPEERYLEGRFGDEYRAYRARVPRWF